MAQMASFHRRRHSTTLNVSFVTDDRLGHKLKKNGDRGTIMRAAVLKSIQPYKHPLTKGWAFDVGQKHNTVYYNSIVQEFNDGHPVDKIVCPPHPGDAHIPFVTRTEPPKAQIKKLVRWVT